MTIRSFLDSAEMEFTRTSSALTTTTWAACPTSRNLMAADSALARAPRGTDRRHCDHACAQPAIVIERAGNPERGEVRSLQMRQQIGRARARRLPYRESSARITRSPIVLVDTSRSNDKPSRMDANHREWWCPARVTPHRSVRPRPLSAARYAAVSTNVRSAVEASRSVRMTMSMSASLGIYARKGAR